MTDRSSSMDRPEAPRGAQALMRALDILDEILLGPARSADLARKLELSKTTTHRLAHALMSRGYLTANRNGFTLGPKLLQLGTMAQAQTDYARVARPFMETLSDQTGLCVFLGKRDGDWALHLDRVIGRQKLRVSTAPGDRRTLAETGLGKALLFDDDQASLDHLYRLARGGTVPDAELEAWHERFAHYRESGVVIHSSQTGDGIRSTAAPIRDAEGRIRLAICIASVAQYLNEDTMPAVAEQVKHTAERISKAIGYDPR
ncbi:MAG TPA: IclR family transcriptional regulator [Sphingomonas sp.]|nr:IclR family transcriptional regulator [Sphingomonas sp.]